MNLDIADEVVEYLELILITFLLVWKERAKSAVTPPLVIGPSSILDLS